MIRLETIGTGHFTQSGLLIPAYKSLKANEGHEYCLKTKYKNEFIKLNGENILLKEMQDKMIQQEGLCGSIKLQLAQDRIQVRVVPGPQ